MNPQAVEMLSEGAATPHLPVVSHPHSNAEVRVSEGVVRLCPELPANRPMSIQALKGGFKRGRRAGNQSIAGRVRILSG
jgi:hypothetical protein